jgi:hypothetical protein
MIQKKDDWQSEYDNFMQQNKKRSFEWGKWDCCIFCNELIGAITGQKILPIKATWHNKETANESIREYGKTLLGSLKKTMKQNGVKEISKQFMTKGDIVLYKQKQHLLGICDGYGVISPNDDGLKLIQDANVIKVYRING